MCRRISKTERAEISSSVAASVIGANEDLLIQILVLLPAKSVVRFKSVCKSWSFLTSTESFTRLHVQNHGRRRRCHIESTQHSFIMNDVNGRPQFFICDPAVKRLVRVSLPRPIKDQGVDFMKILQSMNGLLLLNIKFSGKDEIDHVVFNPTTKQYRFIPLEGHQPSGICIFFDPSKSEYYKIMMSTPSANPRFSVYNSATHQWSHRRVYPFLGISGHYHIISSLILEDTDNNYSNLLVYPDGLDYANYIVESNEHLHFLQLKPVVEGENKCCFRVGNMIDNMWKICKNATLHFDNSKVELLGMMREESIEDSVFLFHVPGRLLIYKFSNDELEVLVDYRDDYFYVEDQLQFYCALPLIHTFASV